jgi:hypothetical protein
MKFIEFIVNFFFDLIVPVERGRYTRSDAARIKRQIAVSIVFKVVFEPREKDLDGS